MIVHARGLAALLFLLIGMGRHGNDRQILGTPLLADDAGSADAVHFGHLHVHQHGGITRPLIAHHVAGDAAIFREIHLQPGIVQQFGRNLAVDLIILDQQHAQPAQRFGHHRQGGRGRSGDMNDGRMFLGENLGDRIQQYLGHDRLGQKGGNLVGIDALQQIVGAIGGDDKRLGLGMAKRRGAQRIDRLHAVQAGHLPVEEGQVIGLAPFVGMFDRGDRLAARRHQVHRHAPAGKDVMDDLARRRIVVGGQHAQPADMRRHRHFQPHRPVVRIHQHVADEAAALAGCALDRNVAAHLLHDLATDGEAKAGATEPPRGRTVRLGEGMEQRFLLLGRHADAGVAHRQLQPHPAIMLGRRQADGDGAFLGKFDGIAHQVEHHLAEAHFVADQPLGHIGIDPRDDPDLLRLGIGRDQLDLVLDRAAQGEGMRFQRQLARFILRKIEDVVDQPQQRHAGLVDLADIILLLGVEVGPGDQMAEAQYGIHRRADFMAHIGQEQALRAIGLLRLAGPRLQRLILGQYLLAHLLVALETLDQLVAQPDQHRRLEGDDAGMQQHPFQIALPRKHRIGQKIEQQQMMQRRRRRRRQDGALVAPGDGQRQHGEEIHVHVHLPGMAAQQEQQDRRLAHQCDGGQIAGRRGDPLPPPGQMIGPRQQCATQRRRDRRMACEQGHRRQQRHMRPEERHEEAAKMETQLVQLDNHDVCPPGNGSPHSIRDGVAITPQAPALRNAAAKSGRFDPAMMMLDRRPMPTSPPSAARTRLIASACDAPQGAITR